MEGVVLRPARSAARDGELEEREEGKELEGVELAEYGVVGADVLRGCAEREGLQRSW